MKVYDVYKKILYRLQQKENVINDILIMDGINTAINIISKTYQISKTSTITAELNKPVKLPSDFIELIFLEKDNVFLNSNDYLIKADFLIITDRELVGELNLLYAGVPDLLVLSENQEIPVPDMFIDSIVSYACYYYTAQDSGISTIYYNEFATQTGLLEKEKQPKQTAAKK